MSRMAKPLFACAAGLATMLAFSAAVSPAFAKEPTAVVYGEREELPTIRVSYSDLNLLSAKGQTRLNNRVSSAVRTLCTDYGVMPLSEIAHMNDCRASAWSSARPQIASAIQQARFNNGLAQAAASISIAARR